MKNIRILFIFSLVFAFITFFIQPSFASNMVRSGANALGTVAEGTSNAVIAGSDALVDAGRAVGGATENTFHSMQNTMNNTGAKMTDEQKNDRTNDKTSDNNGAYTATQTATGRNATEPTLFGMNSTMWTWMIVLLTAVGIGSLIWFYYSAKADIRNHK